MLGPQERGKFQLAVFGLPQEASGVQGEVGRGRIDAPQGDGGRFVQVGSCGQRERIGTAQRTLDQSAEQLVLAAHSSRSARRQQTGMGSKAMGGFEMLRLCRMARRRDPDWRFERAGRVI